MFVVLLRIWIDATQPLTPHTAIGAVIKAMLVGKDNGGACLSHGDIVANVAGYVCGSSSSCPVGIV